MSDNLRADLENAVETAEAAASASAEAVGASAEAPVEAVADAPAVDPVESAASGEDLAEPKEVVEAPQPEIKPKAEPKADLDPEATQEQKAAHRIDRAPASWKKETKETWAALPLNVRQEIHRRENQINQAMAESARHREIAEQYNRVTAPYAARLQAFGGPIQGVEKLLQAEYMLATGTKQQTAQYMAQLIKDYEVDLTALDTILSGQQVQPQAPDISALVNQQVQQALAPLYQQQSQRQQQIQQQADMTVEDMSVDPAYPFFDEVREDMADLIDLKAKKGVYLTLPEAYKMAVQLNPATAGQIQKQATMQTATQHHQQAQKAKIAASSVAGTPGSSGTQVNVGDGSLRGAIEAAFGGQRL